MGTPRPLLLSLLLSLFQFCFLRPGSVCKTLGRIRLKQRFHESLSLFANLCVPLNSGCSGCLWIKAGVPGLPVLLPDAWLSRQCFGAHPPEERLQYQQCHLQPLLQVRPMHQSPCHCSLVHAKPMFGSRSIVHSMNLRKDIRSDKGILS